MASGHSHTLVHDATETIDDDLFAMMGSSNTGGGGADEGFNLGAYIAEQKQGNKGGLFD